MRNEAKGLLIENMLSTVGPNLGRWAELAVSEGDGELDEALLASIAAAVMAMRLACDLIHELTGGAVPLPPDIDDDDAPPKKARVRKPKARRPVDTTQTTAEAAVSHAEGGAE